MLSVSAAHADAKLLNMDSPARVPGLYVVTYKPDAELIQLKRPYVSATPAVGESAIMSATLPTTAASAGALSLSLASSVAGHVQEQYAPDGKGRRGFYGSIPDALVRKLVTDPRIESIEPVMWVQTSVTSQQTLHNTIYPSDTKANYLWGLDRID
jgi:hypothetical protein